MDINEFLKNDFIKSIANNEKWTISTNEKKPIDMNFLKNNQKIIGASFKNDNQPLISLYEVAKLVPNAANATYLLNSLEDNFVVIDIEPSCSPELRDELLKLPYKYCEISMSGKGFHLVMDKPDTKYPNILECKERIRPKNGEYEILMRHYVTFTGYICEPSAQCQIRPFEDFTTLFDALAQNAKLTQIADIELESFPAIETIEKHEKILNELSKLTFYKTQDQYKEYPNHGITEFEYAVMGFYYQNLQNLLRATEFKEYQPEEIIMLLYTTVKDVLPYREKHDQLRSGLPYLLYSCQRLVLSRNT